MFARIFAPGLASSLVPGFVIGALLAAGASGGCSRKEEGLKRRPQPEPAAVVLPPRSGPSPVRFVDATAESGLNFVHDNGFDDSGFYYPEFLGGGVIAFDAEGDGDVDLFFCNGHRIGGDGGGERGTKPSPAAPSRCALFLNDGRGHFTDATESSGLGDERYAQGVCGADYDNDGDVDLYVTMFDEGNALFRNDGHGHFTDVAAKAGVLGLEDGVDGACSFADVDGDGFADLYVGGCVAATRRNHKKCFDTPDDDFSVKFGRYCHPTDFEPLPDRLFRNRGDGTFEDVSRAAGLQELRGRTLGLAFFDEDDDGDSDLFVTCDRSANFLLRNEGRCRFTEIAHESGVALSDLGAPQAGMGTSTGDYDGDGRIDLVATYFEREVAGLYRNLGHDQFENRSIPSGAGSATWPCLKWGTELFDADLDGRLDWLIACGHVDPHIEQFRKQLVGFHQPLLFLLNRGDGKFESLGTEAGAPFKVRRPGRSLATADFDGDGDLDVVLNDNDAPASYLRNDSPRADRHWLAVKTLGMKSNRDGLGARVTATVGGQRLVREIHAAQSYYSQSDTIAHFGLGPAKVVDRLEVRWPSGRTSRMEQVAVDQVVTVEEPQR
jgi:enediyne biosynthesis protein E4